MPRERPTRPAIVLDTLACIVEPEAEFLMLLDHRERTTRRLAELAALLAPDSAAPLKPATFSHTGEHHA